MSEIPMGTIDPARLGCSTKACTVFTEHAKGRTVPEIAGDFRMTEDAVRGEIVGVWHDDARSSYISRRAMREDGAE